MDISLNKTQQNIAKEARRFFNKECPIDVTRSIIEENSDFTEELWAKIRDLDWLAIGIPESYGGMGMEWMDICVVMEEMGRVVFPGPYFSTVILAAEAIIEAGNESQKRHYLSKIADGETLGTLALYEPDGGGDPDYINMRVQISGDSYILNGAKLSVTDARAADFLIVVSRSDTSVDPDQGISLFLVPTTAPGVNITHLPTMDGTRELCNVTFEDVAVSADNLLGELHNGWEPLSRTLRKANVALCAESVGGAQRVMELAVEYAKTRVQFDQPIGAYQAIKHRCAQMYLKVESARSIYYRAAWAQNHATDQEAAIAASAAKSYCSEAYTMVTGSAIQVLGATGFSWENDVHLYLKRAKANEMAFGGPSYHRERVIRVLENTMELPDKR